MKKLLAILCAVTMIICSLFTGVVVAAEDPALTVYKPSQLVMGGGAGCATGVVQGNAFDVSQSAVPIAAGLGNAELQAKVAVGTLNTTKVIRFYSPGNGIWSGIDINFAATGISVTNEWGYDFSGLTIDTINPLGQTFDLTFTSVVAGEDCTLTLTVGEETRTITLTNADLAAKLPLLQSFGINGVILYDTDYVFPNTEKVEPAASHLPTITLDDFTNLDGTPFKTGKHYNTWDAGISCDPNKDWGFPTKSMFNTVLDVNVMLDLGGYFTYPARRDYGNGIKIRSLDGINVELVDEGGFILPNGGLLKSIPAAELGYTEITGKTFNYKVAIEMVNEYENKLLDENGEVLIDDLKIDVKLTYYINNKQVYTTVIPGSVGGEGYGVATDTGYEYVVEGGAELLKNNYGVFDVFSANNGEFTVPTQVPNLPVVTPDQTGRPWNAGGYGMPDGAGAGQTGTWLNTFKPNTVFSADVTLEGNTADGLNGAIFHFSTLNNWVLTMEWGQIYLRDIVTGALITKITPDDTSYAPYAKLNIKLSWEQADFNKDGIATDINFGIFINDKHYKFIELPNAYPDIYAMSFGVFPIQLYKPTASDVADPSDPFAGFETITLEDFGIANGTYTNYSSPYFYNPTVPMAKGYSLNGKVLKTTITMGNAVDGADYFTILGNIGGHNLYINRGGWVMDAMGCTGYTPNNHPLNGFVVGGTNELAITYEYVGGDMVVGIWVNGVFDSRNVIKGLGTNAYQNMALASNKIGFFVTSGDPITIGAPAVENKNVESEDNSFTVVPAEGETITVNGGEPITGEATYTAIGKYVVETSRVVSLYFGDPSDCSTTKTVVIYKDKDLNGDSVVNILDFIIAKKNAGGIRPLTDALELAAAGKADAADLITPAELIAIKRAVLFG